MPKRNIFAVLVTIACSAVSWLALDHAGHGRRFAEVLDAIERAYIEPVDQQALFDAAMDGVFSKLDEHSAFVVGERRERLESLLDQEFGGVGLEVAETSEPRGFVVVTPLHGSPAWRAGVAAGDRIVAIDGVPTAKMAMEEVLRLLRGSPGSAVTLALVGPDAEVREVSVVREVVRTESVLGDRRRTDGAWEWFVEGEPGVAVVRIASFGERTAGEVRDAIGRIAAASGDDTDSESPVGMLVLDLRGNAGGLLSAAVEVCDLFLDEGVIVSTRGRSAGDEPAGRDLRRAARGAELATVPMAVLVDGLTASAAEVVAACLQDHGRAVVVGSRTFGKGTVQSILELSDGTGLLKLTTAEYLRPSRVQIHRRGDDGTNESWGVSPDPGFEITLTGRQLEAWDSWRRSRDAVPPTGYSAAAAMPPSLVPLPRQADMVLAAAIDGLNAGRRPAR